MLLSLLVVACVHHIPDPGAAAAGAVDPEPSATSDVTVCWLEFATGSLPHGTAVAHGALHKNVDSTQSGLLFKSSLGNWLVHGGQAADVRGAGQRGGARFRGPSLDEGGGLVDLLGQAILLKLVPFF